jgi:membrane-associated phospholipid phosphatase
MLFMVLTSELSRAAEINDLTFSGEIVDASRRLGNETRDLVATPLQLDNGNALVTLGVAGAFALVYSYDSQIHDKLTARPNKSLDKATEIGSLAGDPYIQLGLAAAVYGGALLADSAKWKEVGEMMAEAMILADAASLVIKESAGRGRPNLTSSKSDFKPFSFRKDYDSLPSMHTASSFALASVMAATSENLALKTAYYGAAAFVGYSRMYQNKHWASDVLLGAAIGELCGRVVTGFHAKRNRLILAPQVDERSAGLAVVGKW